MKKILHISNWYPNKWDDLDGIFIKEQYKVFSEITETHLVNVQVREGTQLLSYKYIKYTENEEGYYLFTKIESNKIIEFLTTFLLLWVLFKQKYKQYDLLHFHIAYPLLMHYYIWKKIVKIPVMISEHWSAYHFNFYMPKNTKKLDGIKRIFKQKIPIIIVSKSLKKDIEIFSGTDNFNSIVIPNIVNRDYKPKEKISDYPIFFMVNIWREIKNPFPLLEAFVSLSKSGMEFELRLGGYGELIVKMKSFVEEHNLDSKIIFLGKLNPQDIERELTECDAYLFSSKYETFSIACADAIHSGCPLIGPPIPAILEYTDSEDIIIVSEDNALAWEKSIQSFTQNRKNYNKEKISIKTKKYFSKNRIKALYKGFIDENF